MGAVYVRIVVCMYVCMYMCIQQSMLSANNHDDITGTCTIMIWGCAEDMHLSEDGSECIDSTFETALVHVCSDPSEVTLRPAA